MIVMGSYTKTTNWALGERIVIAQLRPLTKRFVLLSDSPWIRHRLTVFFSRTRIKARAYATSHRYASRCKWRRNAIATVMHVQYLDITPLLCGRASVSKRD